MTSTLWARPLDGINFLDPSILSCERGIIGRETEPRSITSPGAMQAIEAGHLFHGSIWHSYSNNRRGFSEGIEVEVLTVSGPIQVANSKARQFQPSLAVCVE